MLVGLKQLQPKVFAEAEELMSFSPSPLTNTVVTSTNGQVLVYRFLSSGTWTKQSNNSFVIVFAWNGGCGGGSGSYGRPAGGVQSGSGGAGGAGGNSFVLMLPAYYFGSSTTITVGAGGTGGASITTLNTAGNPGNVGGQTMVGGISVPLKPAGVGGGGWTSGPGNPNAIGGTAGSSSYVMSGGYSIADGTQIGATNNPVSMVNFAYMPADTIIGSSTIRMPCLPFAVSTGGGSGTDSVSSLTTGGTNGGSIILFGNVNTYGGAGAQLGNQGSVGQPIGGPGTYLSWPYGGVLLNGYGQMFVTGGTGGGGTGQGTTQNPLTQQAGGPGGIGAGGGGGGGRSAGGPSLPTSGKGGPGGQGLVLIYEFI